MRSDAGRRPEPPDELCYGRTDFLWAVLLNEMHAGHCDFGLVGPAPDIVTDAAGDDRAGLGVDEQFRHVGFLEPAPVLVDQRDDLGGRYCFARPTHEYLDFNPGTDFDTQVVVKTNVAAVLRHELRRPSWRRETVALGTNTDPYQRAEGRYALMPGIIGALAASGTPLSILTKGTLLRRDLPLIAEAAQQVPVSVAVSLAVGDPELHRDVESGTPTPQARLALITAIRAAGLDCHVMVAPVLPQLTDSGEHLDQLLGQIAAAGATGVTVFGLHLRGSTRGWFMCWLARAHPELVSRYRELYRRGPYLPPSYREMLRERVAPLIAKYRLAGDHRPAPPETEAALVPVQATLF